ncbi:hypothetical protein DAI22_01g166650 [Oryza sativa Japonica Group]|nr:hypothetical protein DAI22_01g166650 [Oryza sativa Japonica Group]
MPISIFSIGNRANFSEAVISYAAYFVNMMYLEVNNEVKITTYNSLVKKNIKSYVIIQISW